MSKRSRILVKLAQQLRKEGMSEDEPKKPNTTKEFKKNSESFSKDGNEKVSKWLLGIENSTQASVSERIHDYLVDSINKIAPLPQSQISPGHEANNGLNESKQNEINESSFSTILSESEKNQSSEISSSSIVIPQSANIVFLLDNVQSERTLEETTLKNDKAQEKIPQIESQMCLDTEGETLTGDQMEYVAIHYSTESIKTIITSLQEQNNEQLQEKGERDRQESEMNDYSPRIPTGTEIKLCSPCISKSSKSPNVMKNEKSITILQNVKLSPKLNPPFPGLRYDCQRTKDFAVKPSELVEDEFLGSNIHEYSEKDNLLTTKPVVPLDEYLDELAEFSDFDDSDKDPDYSPSDSEIEQTMMFDTRVLQSDKDENEDPILPEPTPSLLEKSDTSLLEKLSISEEQRPEKALSRISNSTDFYQESREVERTDKKHYKDKRDFCIFCERDVSHFGRHIFKWHAAEFEVQKIESYKINSKERREALSYLRKKGNFVKNGTDVKLMPVKRPKSDDDKATTADEFLPCKYCLGFYKKKYLYRHTKQCVRNPELGVRGQRQTAQSDGQSTLMMMNIHKQHQLLKTILFPRMRADEISFIAKKDPLICSYGYSHLKGRRSKGNLDFLRQNMRRLAKLVKFAGEKNKEVKQLIDVLKPSLFEIIIDAVNKMAQFNPETDRYESPTLAMNFGTLLKKCCDLAYIKLLQIPGTDGRRKDIKIMKKLIESQWANEVSAQAASNLNENKWNKNDLLPLTSDLKKLNSFLQISANDAFDLLSNEENNKKAYQTLKETLYCKILLLNRRRPAEVAQMKIQTYNSVDLDCSQGSEFAACLTETEKILLNTYNRIVIRGKRGRGVPVLLSPDMRKHFDLMVKIRHNFVKENDFIFHSGGKGCIDGTKILHKYAQMCGAERPKSISATRLRKHLATITQLLQFSNNDLEQLSKFMGHTLKTHCDVYRMTDDMYQTAKISKLLLLIMEGGAENFKGKTLEEIDIDMSPVSEEMKIEDMICGEESEITTSQKEEKPQLVSVESQGVSQATIRYKKKEIKQPPVRRSWTIEQKEAIRRYFLDHIQKKRPPKRFEVEKFVELNPVFENTKWTTIKAIVYNIYTQKLKLQS